MKRLLQAEQRRDHDGGGRRDHHIADDREQAEGKGGVGGDQRGHAVILPFASGPQAKERGRPGKGRENDAEHK